MAHTQHIYKHKTTIFKVVTELIHFYIEQYVSACNFISVNFWQTHGGNVGILRMRFPPFQFTQKWRELRWRRLWRTSPNAWKNESSSRVNRDGMLFYGKLSLYQSWQQSYSKHMFFRLVLGPRPTGPVGPTIWWVRVPGFPGKKMCNTSSDNNLIILRKLNHGEQGWHVILWKVIVVSELTAIIFKTYVLPFGAWPQTYRPSRTHNLVSVFSGFPGKRKSATQVQTIIWLYNLKVVHCLASPPPPLWPQHVHGGGP